MLVPPMTMMDFFRKSEGIWFIHRTVHHFDTVKDESGESKIHVKVLTRDDPKVQNICEAQGGAGYLAKAKEFLDTAHVGPFSSPHFVETYLTALARMENLVQAP